MGLHFVDKQKLTDFEPNRLRKSNERLAIANAAKQPPTNLKVGSNFTIMKNLTICILILLSVNAYGQEITIGDTTKIREIQRKCSKIYDTTDSTTFLLTKSTFYEKAEGGTNIIVYSYKDKINRIVAFTTTRTGLLGVEYYFWDSQIIMIYETMEYFDEDSPKGQIRNFKNIPYWESRFYINNNKLVAHRHSGRKGLGIDYKAQIEIDNSKDILEFVNEQTSLE